MLYIRMGVVFYRLWLELGYSGDALRPMQVLNAFFGAGTILLFGLVLRNFTKQWTWILLVSMTVGLSYAFWTHTVDAFFIISASFFVILALASALGLSSSNSATRSVLFTLLLGTSFSLAALSYQANLAVIPALLVASYPIQKTHLSSYLWSWVAVTIIVAVIAGGLWLGQGIGCAHVQSPQALVNWFFSGHGGVQNGHWRREGVNLAVKIPMSWVASILPMY